MTIQELKAEAQQHAANYTKMNAAKVEKVLNDLGIKAQIFEAEDIAHKTNKAGKLITKTTRKTVKRLYFTLNGIKYNGLVSDGIGLAMFLAANIK